MTRFVNIVLVLVLVAALGSSGVSSAAQTMRREPFQPEVVAARKAGGLRAAAAAAGGEYASDAGAWIPEVAFTLETLARLSDVVLMGTLGENLAHLSASGEYITTDFRMTVERRLKGQVLPGATVVFGVMGGKVVFEDGSSALIGTKGFIRPNSGARVVIFATLFRDDDEQMPPAVRAYANGAPIFRLVGMGRGVYELPDDENGMIRMNAVGAKDATARKLRGLNRGQFIGELERAVKQPPKMK